VSTVEKLLLLTTLYFSQGLPYGFFTHALPTFLRQKHLPLSLIGMSSLLTLPWALKFLWAPLVDRYGSERLGRRRSWILPLQCLAVVNLAMLTTIDPGEQLWLVCAAVLMTNLLAATQDIATDAFAVDLLEPHERGLANGIQVAGYRVGMVVGGGVMLMLLDQLGWASTFLAMATMLLLATLPILAHRERPQPSKAYADVRMDAILELVRRPGMSSWLMVLVVYKVGDYLATGMVKPLLVDLKLSMKDIGMLMGVVGCVAGLIGAMVGGYGAQVLGRRQALLVFGGLQSLSIASYMLPAMGYSSWNVLYATCIFEHLSSGMATVTLFTMMMDRCEHETAATDYTVQASIVVIASGSAAALSGFSATLLGYAGHFALSTAVSALALILIARLLPPGKDLL
jgi:RhtX/FptX family siderophore transporter